MTEPFGRTRKDLYSVVSIIATEQLAPCATELGTLPSTRRAPFIPLLPTTIKSAPTSSAVAMIASTGSPITRCRTGSTPLLLATKERDCSKASAPPEVPKFLNSAGRLLSECITVSYADTICNAPADMAANSVAASSARRAVNESSAPTTITLNTTVLLAMDEAAGRRNFSD
jgi:hypothetical protein